MKIFNINAVKLLLVVVVVASFAACKKSNGFDSKRQTIVRIKDAEKAITVLARDVTPTIETFQLADIRRDADNEAGLNQSVTVTIANQQSVIDDYNTDNGTSFELLPANSYTLSEDLSNLVFGPGDFVKNVMITLDKSQLDLSKQYALGLTITNVGDGAVASATYNTAVYSVGVKNKYDGSYTLNGKFYHPTQSPGYDPFTVDVEMHTSGPNSVKLYVPDFGGYYSPGLFAGSLNAFGSQEPEFTIDPTTNAVTVQNAYSGAVTFYTMTPGYNSHYDPATKTIYAKWGYGSGGPYPPFDAATTREWEDVFVYTGPR